MKLKYFGTDGIRGEVGGDLLNETFVKRLGHAVAGFLRKHNPYKPITVVIGRDTRASGLDFQRALSEGFCALEQHVVYLGVVPTPCIALTVQQLHADFGIAITASHNPSTDNGIKLFDNRGHKLAVETEAEIERLIDEVGDERPEAGTCGYDHDGHEHYVNFMRSLLHQDSMRGWKIVIDCANGATYKTTPEAFSHFGGDLIVVGNEPDGQNINDGVGSEHPQKVGERVKAEGAMIGIAHDGDGDRLVLCDETGSVVDGDQLLGVLALQSMRSGALNKNTLVATIQSNLGLDRSLEAAGGQVVRVDVGDRNVLHTMISGEYTLGGEQSGHVIFRNHLEAGDGLIAALKTIEVMLATGKKLSELLRDIEIFPQGKKNLRVAEKIPLTDCKALQQATRDIEESLQGQGRLLIRYSGTEPKLRLLVEAKENALLAPSMDALIAAASQDLEVIG